MKFQTLRSHILKALKKSLEARRIAGKPVLSQLIEMLRLRFSEAKISPAEYYQYELYNDHLFSFAAKRDFLGNRSQAKLYASLNSLRWSATARDKILFDTLMRGLGVRIPKLYAVYSPTYRMLNDVPCITELNVMTDFIQNKMSYPFFAKPIRRAHGVGAIAVNCFDPGNNTLLIRTGEQIRVHDFVTNLFHVDESGYLFQECLAPHPVFLSDDGPHLLHAIWRIPRGSNMTDSFAGGTTGNLFGRIDIKTGRVVEVVQRISPYRSLTEVHPDSGKPVTGVTLPNWEDTVELCLSTATALPELRLQSWDVAMCPDGPLLIEVNHHGILRFVQIACRAGFRNTEFRRYLASLHLS
jgi:Sugar-transfer associated ATP-grasp